jgi:L-methionine (R)-S-oxide reductase
MGEHDPATQSWLEGFIRDHGGVAGTVHRAAAEGGDANVLHLAAAVNIPPKVQDITRVIPRGKGMAGLALERGRPVQTCNLKTDQSGDVRPGAKAVDAQAAVAIPVQAENGTIRAVVGIAYMGERELSDDELAALSLAAAELPG